MEFLLIAVAVAAVGIAVVLWRNREPRGPHGHVSDFQRTIRALSPDPPPRHRPPRRDPRNGA